MADKATISDRELKIESGQAGTPRYFWLNLSTRAVEVVERLYDSRVVWFKKDFHEDDKNINKFFSCPYTDDKSLLEARQIVEKAFRKYWEAA